MKCPRKHTFPKISACFLSILQPSWSVWLKGETHQSPSTQRNGSTCLHSAETSGKCWQTRSQWAEKAGEEPVTVEVGGKRRRKKKHTSVIREWRTREHAAVSAGAHHEGDLLAGLRLPPDQKDAAAEEQQAHGQQHQDPHLCSEDGADVVLGEIAKHTHHDHCGAGAKS